MYSYLQLIVVGKRWHKLGTTGIMRSIRNTSCGAYSVSLKLLSSNQGRPACPLTCALPALEPVKTWSYRYVLVGLNYIPLVVVNMEEWIVETRFCSVGWVPFLGVAQTA
jgi:hypothetical protein